MSETMETKVEEVTLDFGTVSFRPGEAPVPATEETHGAVTIQNTGKEGVPPHFLVVFRVHVRAATCAGACRNTIEVSIPVKSRDEMAPYRQIETEAARQLAPMLRSVADTLQAQIEAFEAERAEDAPG